MILEQRVRKVAESTPLTAEGHLEIPIPGADRPCVIHNVDPTPCYSADWRYVMSAADDCEKVFPLPILPFYFTLPYEPAGRNNACAPVVYLDDGAAGWTTAIYISGKRIPIIPAVIQALVAHEYSHHIERYISWKLGRSIEPEYAALRKIPIRPNPRWHEDIGEIIANDCRILVFGTEPDYWPHDCAHPFSLSCDAIAAFWQRMKMEYAR